MYVWKLRKYFLLIHELSVLFVFIPSDLINQQFLMTSIFHGNLCHSSKKEFPSLNLYLDPLEILVLL